MSELGDDLEIRLYPELLRRMAAGERLASSGDEAEKLAATALVVEALESEKVAQPDKAASLINPNVSVNIGQGTLASAGAAVAGAALGALAVGAMYGGGEKSSKDVTVTFSDPQGGEKPRQVTVSVGKSEKKAEAAETPAPAATEVAADAEVATPEESAVATKALLDRVLKHLQ